MYLNHIPRYAYWCESRFLVKVVRMCLVRAIEDKNKKKTSANLFVHQRL